ncbi:hypothetical protein L6164_027532 [Bauhinia variegata]|uniref:Uncharacterized protein n=1 Tax=Bauhinia variegata TaxID=167791 RepID=A0ACB9LUW1_BAUVA|nr:hypothetical protein L6164_027532 [Bauhinia variegata]
MQDPKAASGDLSTTTSRTKSSPPSSPSPTVNPHPITASAGGKAVELKGEGGSSAVAGVQAGSSEVKGSVTDGDSVNLKRKWVLRDTPSGSPRCPECALEFPSWRSVFGHLRAHPDRAYRDNVEAGQGIDLNLKANEGETAVEVELESTHTPMESVEDAAAAAGEKRSGGAAADENAMEGDESSEAAEGKTTESPALGGKRMKIAVEVKDEIKEEVAPMEGVESTSEAKPAHKNEMEAGSSSSANKDELKKVFAFDLNELPPPDDGEDNSVP